MSQINGSNVPREEVVGDFCISHSSLNTCAFKMSINYIRQLTVNRSISNTIWFYKYLDPNHETTIVNTK